MTNAMTLPMGTYTQEDIKKIAKNQQIRDMSTGRYIASMMPKNQIGRFFIAYVIALGVAKLAIAIFA